MGFDCHISDFEGLPVQNFDRENLPDDLGGNCWRISIDWEAYEDGVKFTEQFARLLKTPGARDLQALIVGCWEGGAEGESSEDVVEALVAARAQLPQLEHLFLGEMLQEECEVSWINQSDLSPFFLAFPKLVTLRVRGMEGLSLGRPEHAHLRSLILEGGGMPAAILNELAAAQLPNLEHLELWLGDEGYGRGVTKESLQPILDGTLFPKLNYLGLRNDHDIDTTVTWLKDAKILDQLDVLDISLGTLSDTGAAALLDIGRLGNVKKLDAFYNFMSAKAAEALQRGMPTVEIDVSERQEPDEYDGKVYRYNFVSE